MRFATVFFAVFVATWAKSIDDCKVTDWGKWSECRANFVENSASPAFSFPIAPTPGADRGRAMMEIAIEEKSKVVDKRRQCQEDQTCPEYNARPTTVASANCVNGLAGEYPCRNVDLLSIVSIEDLGYTKAMQKAVGDKNVRGNDIWGWTDPMSGKEYAIIGLSGGTSFVDVTDAETPKVLAFLPTRTVASIWRDMKVVYNTAYIVSEAKDHGLQVFDLERLRTMTSFSYVNSDTDYSLFGNAHNIISNEETGYVYVVGATDKNYAYSCNGGLHYINVRDRLNPAYAGCFADDGYVHDAQCVIYTGPHVDYRGREICFCYNEDTLTIVDVTDKDQSVLLSKAGYSSSMYTHQGWLSEDQGLRFLDKTFCNCLGWLTEDQTIVLLDDELDENKGVTPEPGTAGQTITYLWDVSDLHTPTLRQHYISAEVAIDHNQYVLGDLTYQSNYGAGLRILHIDQANYDLKEVAYFDCLPTNRPTAEFEGTWSNYPYFKSGNVIVSSIEYGLFTVRPNAQEILKAIDLPAYREQVRSRDIEFATPHATCPGLVQPRDCSVSALEAEATP